MNYLAHLHIACSTKSSFVGNFLGDFVKGNPDGQFSQGIVQGIRLHRFVDSYTDQHPIVKSLKPLFSGELRRFAPIALDMFWDHCLAKYWDQFHYDSLTSFCQQAELKIKVESQLEAHLLPARFIKVSQLVWQQSWFESYREMDNIHFALQRMALRSPRMAALGKCGEALSENYEFFLQQFFVLYPDILERARLFIANNETSETKKEAVASF